MATKTALSLYTHRLNRVLQVWVAIRFFNLFVSNVAHHSALHTEARLLVTFLCNTDKGYKISGALIDCGQARTLLATKSFAITYAAEKSFRTLLTETWDGATDKLVGLAKLLGLIATFTFTIAFLVHDLWMRAQTLQHNRKLYGESFMQAAAKATSIPVSSRVFGGEEEPARTGRARNKFD